MTVMKADIGVIGLAVMGENLILNMESKGFTVACYNRTVSKVDEFVEGRAKGKRVIGCHSVEEFCDRLAPPRKALLMVKAGQPVDDFIDLLLPHLDPGDIVIDGGNSFFGDTIRRTRYVEDQGLRYIGTGISGGEEGALMAPASCLAAARLPGPTSNRSFRPSQPRWQMERLVVTGSAAMEPATMSKWFTMVSSMGTCR
jgi:6-phosphogluconate dehydrogenase